MLRPDQKPLNGIPPAGDNGTSPRTAVPGMVPFQIYEGKVVGIIPGKNLVEVRFLGNDQVKQCVWVAGAMSGLLGVNTAFLPPIGTHVIAIYSGRQISWIIGLKPGQQVDPGSPTRTTLDVDGQAYAGAQRFTSHPEISQLAGFTGNKPPVDLVEGELQIDFLTGVGISLLRHLASLQAGDLARVECHILDDLVRIISGNFKHFNALGEHTITNDNGRLNAVWHGTSKEHEAWGLEREKDQKFDPAGATPKLPAEDPVQDGRWRFSQFVGWLGDFVHIFLSDPVDRLGRLAEDAVRAGKFRLHVNNDGSVLVQSVADIVLEKVVRIPVPVKLRREDDMPDKHERRTEVPSPLPVQWRPSDQQSLFEMAFQLREYARWLNNTLAFQRFRQMPDDWKIPTEADSGTPDLCAQEKDKRDVDSSARNWQLAYACMRIYRDGSIQHVDAYGNAYTSTAVGVQISSTRDILLQAAGSVNIVAGRDVNVRGRKNVNLVADTEAIRIKGEAVKIMAAVGNIVLQTVDQAKVFLKAILRLGDSFEVDRDGNVKCAGEVQVNSLTAADEVSATKLSAGQTVADGEGPHYGHVIQGGGGPVVNLAHVEDKFTYQAGYGPTKQYETLSQSALAREEQTADTDWNLTDGEVESTKPWPGSMSYLTTRQGETLQQASSAEKFDHTPAAMTPATPILKART